MPDFADLGIASTALADPTTSADDLSAIAAAQPSLGAQVVVHPNVYPDLLVWLGQYGDARARAAVARASLAAARRDAGDAAPSLRPVLSGEASSGSDVDPGADTPTMAAYGIVPASGMASPSGQAFPSLRDSRRPRKAIVAKEPLIVRAPRIAGVLFGVAILLNVAWGVLSGLGVLRQWLYDHPSSPAWWLFYRWPAWPSGTLWGRSDYKSCPFFGLVGRWEGTGLEPAAIVSCCALVVACVASLCAAFTRRRVWLVAAAAAAGACEVPFVIWLASLADSLSFTARLVFSGMLVFTIIAAVIACVMAIRPPDRPVPVPVRWLGMVLLGVAALCALEVDGSAIIADPIRRSRVQLGSLAEFVPYLLVLAAVFFLLLSSSARVADQPLTTPQPAVQVEPQTSSSVPLTAMAPVTSLDATSAPEQAQPVAGHLRPLRLAGGSGAPLVAGVLFAVVILLNVVWGVLRPTVSGSWFFGSWSPWPCEGLCVRADVMRVPFFGGSFPLDGLGSRAGSLLPVAIVSCCALAVACVASLCAACTRRPVWLVWAAAAAGMCVLPFAIWTVAWADVTRFYALVELFVMLMAAVAAAAIAIRLARRPVAAPIRWLGVELLGASAFIAWRANSAVIDYGSLAELVPYLSVLVALAFLLLGMPSAPQGQRSSTQEFTSPHQAPIEMPEQGA